MTTWQALLLWAPIVVGTLVLIAYVLVVSPERRRTRADDKSLRLARRMIEAHERGDVAEADQISAQARQSREQRRGRS